MSCSSIIPESKLWFKILPPRWKACVWIEISYKNQMHFKAVKAFGENTKSNYQKKSFLEIIRFLIERGLRYDFVILINSPEPDLAKTPIIIELPCSI